MTTDAQALAIATRALPQEPRAAIHYALAVSLAEGTHYGDAWGAEGAGSFNWGGVQEPHPTETNSFPHLDHHADNSPYTGHFKRYPSSEAGFKDFAFNLLKPNVLAALEAGNGTDAAFAQHANGYYELAPEKYAAAVEKQYAGFLRRTGEPRLLTFPDPGNPPAGTPTSGGTSSTVSGLVDAAIGVGVVLGMAWLADTFGGPKPPKGDR